MRIFLIVLTCLFVSACANKASTTKNEPIPPPKPLSINAWLEQQVYPQLVAELTHNPMLAGQTVTIDVQNRFNSIALKSIENRLIQLLEHNPEISFVSPFTSPPVSTHTQNLYALDCDDRKFSGDIILKLEIPATMPPVIKLSAYDINHKPLTNTKLRYQYGPISPSEKLFKPSAQFGNPKNQGTKSNPFYEDERESIAIHMARKIACMLNKQWDGDSIQLYSEKLSDSLRFDQKAIASINSRLSLHLARFNQINLVANRKDANVTLEQSHEETDITNVYKTTFHLLSSYLLPSSSKLPHTFIYFNSLENRAPPIENPQTPTAIHSQPVRTSVPFPKNNPVKDIIEAFNIVVPADLDLCSTNDPWIADKTTLKNTSTITHHYCFSLEVVLNQDATIFVLYEDKNNDLQKMLPTQCAYFKDVTSNPTAYEITHFPHHKGKVKALDLKPGGGKESFYLIASQSDALNRRIEQTIANITDICEGTDIVDKTIVKANLSGLGTSFNVENWLTTLQAQNQNKLFWQKRFFTY